MNKQEPINSETAPINFGTMNNGYITSPLFNDAFSRLLSIRSIPAFARHKLVKLARAIDEQQKDLQERRRVSLSEATETDDDGNPKVQEDKVNFMWKSDEIKEKFTAEWTDIMNSDFVLFVPLLKIKDLDKLDLSVAELLALDGMFQK